MENLTIEPSLILPQTIDLVPIIGLNIAITWCPNPSHCGTQTPREQLMRYIPQLRDLKKVSTHFWVYPELSINGSIHFHGAMLITDKIKWYHSVLPGLKQIGFCLIKPNPNQQWVVYCQKEVTMMEELLNTTLPLHPNHILLLVLRTSKMPECNPKVSRSQDIRTCSIYSDDSE